jgi:non-canonical (house-cleaning) NTP pyrophosphatase
MGLVTAGRVTRADAARQALLFALAPFIRPELYPPEDHGSAHGTEIVR